ncbi:MAG: hypothetical protein AAF790_11870 [Planctomycetota bacterium]
MPTVNPYQSPRSQSPEPVSPDGQAEGAAGDAARVSSTQAAYNVVADTAVGVNYRVWDNVMQASIIFVSAVALSMVGSIYAALFSGADTPWWIGALVGGFVGVVVGLFGSGVFLMVYRAVRHARGQHD